MSIAENSRAVARAVAGLGLACAMALAPLAVSAQPAPAAAAASDVASDTASASAPAADASAAPAPVASASAAPAAAADTGSGVTYVPARPVAGKGQPIAGAYGFQKQYSPIGEEALFMHDALLMPVITVVTLVVLLLLLVVMARYNRRANPVPSRTSHNTLIEVIWTLVPVLILVVIAVPSIRLLAHQYKSPPKNALTVKVTGYQWYWGYGYPDNGGFEVISNILPADEAIKRGEQPQLGADKRMVVPAGEDIRIQTTGSDVIHSFSVPSLWFKLDAVPGRINERVLHINEPGVYYGQCSELCGVRHGYMPIVVEAVPRPVFDAWVKAQGGTVGAPAKAADAAPATHGA
jgi:cytochrome c oxidase subunit II